MQLERSWMSYVRGLPDARKTAFGAAACLLSGVVILMFTSRFIDTSQPHLYGALNDQIAYINVARSLVTRGTVQSDTILPATLWQQTSKDVLYMPGHPAAIALSYKLFGVGAFQSILPSLVSYLIAILAIYFIGVRLYEPVVGLVAGFLFALFPPVIFFAFTAMSELTFVAAFTGGVCVCLYLPRRLRAWLGPICLAVPFLFRETASFAVIPLGLYFWLDDRDKWWRSLVFVILAVLLMGTLFRSELSAGRPTLLKAHLFGDWHAVYDDAPGQEAATNVRWQEWARVVPRRAVGELKALFVNPDFAPAATGSNYIVMFAMAFAAFAAIFRRDKFAWALTLLNIISITALVILFSSSGYRGMRFLLFTYPLNVVVVASSLVEICTRVNIRGLIFTVSASLIAAAIPLFGLNALRHVYGLVTDRYLVNRSLISAVANLGYLLILALFLFGLMIVLRRRRAGTLRLKTAFTGLTLPLGILPTISIFAVSGVVVLSAGSEYKSFRFLVVTYAISIVVLGWLLSRMSARMAGNKQTLVAASVCAAVLLVFSLVVVRDMYRFFAEQDQLDRSFAAALEGVDIDRNRMLVTPFEMAIRYRYDHFPVSWSFLPYNRATLDLLAARYDIGTMILRDQHPLLKDPATLAAYGFYQEQVLSINHWNYVVYKRPAQNKSATR